MKNDKTIIPEGWKEDQIGTLIVEKPKSTIKVSDAANFGEFPFFTSGESVLYHDKKIIEGSNLFLATGGVANIKYYDGDAAYSTDTYTISTDETTVAKYLYYYLLNSIGYINKNYFEGSGLKHLQKKDFRQHIIYLPASPAEQRKIASILSKIDEAITQTEQLIEKYEQIKTGLMHDLLTRGIDEQGNIRSEETHKFKDSPLGRIPVEWKVEKLENLLAPIPNNIRSGPFGSALTKSEWVNTGIPYLGIDNVHREKFVTEFNRFISEVKFKQLEKYKVRPNDVMVTIMGTVGRCCVVPENIGNAISSKHVWTMSFAEDKYISDLICYQLNYSPWILSVFNEEVQGGIMQSINSTTLKSLLFPKPNIEEQKSINKKLKQINTQICTHQEILYKIKNIKSGLMHDLLTGKVRVDNCEEQQEKTSIVDFKDSKTQARNQYFEDAVLISAIVNGFYSEKYFLGRKKVQKLLYLLRRHQEASTACFKKKAAGPYADKVRYKGGEPIAKRQKYIHAKTNNAGTIFSKGDNIEQALGYIEKWNMQRDIEWLSSQFKYVKVDQLEMIATVDMARCDLEEEGIPVTLSTIKNLIATNEEWKAKLEKSFFDDLSIQKGIDESYKLFNSKI